MHAEGDDEIPDLPVESIKPHVDVGEQPQDQGSDPDTEMGMSVEQRELAPQSSMTGVICDGDDCPYKKATLPGSKGFTGSYFPIEQIEEDKTLLEHLINKMKGKPYNLDEREKLVEKLMKMMNTIRKNNEIAVTEDMQKPPSERAYSEPKNSTGTLEAPPSTYEDQNELYCAISTRTR